VAVKHLQNDKMSIATGVWAGDTLYLSGMVCCEVTPASLGLATAAKQTPEDLRRHQNASRPCVRKDSESIARIKGLDMKDVVKLTVFLAPDAQDGQAGFRGYAVEYLKYFGTPTPA